MSKGLEIAIKTIQDAGFGFIKVELEANLERGDSDYYCDSCDDGIRECYECDGYGTVTETSTSPSGREIELTVVCNVCDGDGQLTCGDCDGRGSSESGGWGESQCQQFILDHVAMSWPERSLVYSEFYNDGSVDSEFTFTLSAEYADKVPLFIDAFNALGEEIGYGVDTSNAGMHVSVLNDSNYPNGQKPLDQAKIANFKTEVSKLLPALYFVASPDHKSRGLNYRPPRIASDKYAAISTHGDTCLEYRIFETCYQKPEAFLDYVEVIANTLKFYSNRKITLAPKPLRMSDGQGIERFYKTPEALEQLNAGLPFLRPLGKTITTLKRERNFKVTQTKLRKAMAVAAQEYRAEYDRYVVRQNEYTESRVHDLYLRARRDGISELDQDWYGNFVRIAMANDWDTAKDELIRLALDGCWMHPTLDFESYVTSERHESGYAVEFAS